MLPIFNKIIILSKQIANALLKDEQPTDLNKSDLFNEDDKTHILTNLTDESLIKQRLDIQKQIDKKTDWKKIKSRIEVPVRNIYWHYAAAATVVGILATTYFFKDNITDSSFNNTTPIIVNNEIEPGTEKATLTLNNGEAVALVKGTTYQTQNATSNGEEIVYNNSANSSSQELVYNYLSVPQGGQFHIKLSDDTEVWLNSESLLKFPVSFTDGESRQVELVYGEAYFDVSHSTEHKGADFRVIHDQQEVQVLGTEFNIKAYKEETNVYTTLVQGKVAVSFENQNKILKPGEQLNLNIFTKNANISMVDVYDQISWKKGVFSFKRKSLKEIMQVLSRWYDMEVDFENKDLESVGFSGVLGKEQSIDEILEIIKDFGVIKNYEIHNKRVILK